nr:hypothetical protein CFP56_33596 [Quercus suber]
MRIELSTLPATYSETKSIARFCLWTKHFHHGVSAAIGAEKRDPDSLLLGKGVPVSLPSSGDGFSLGFTSLVPFSLPSTVDFSVSPFARLSTRQKRCHFVGRRCLATIPLEQDQTLSDREHSECLSSLSGIAVQTAS